MLACTPVSTLQEEYWQEKRGGEEGEEGAGDVAKGDKKQSSKERKLFLHTHLHLHFLSLPPLSLPPSPLSPSPPLSSPSSLADTLQTEEPEQMEEDGAVPAGDETTPTPVPVEVMTKIASCLEELKKCLEEAPHTMVSTSNLLI